MYSSLLENALFSMTKRAEPGAAIRNPAGSCCFSGLLRRLRRLALAALGFFQPSARRLLLAALVLAITTAGITVSPRLVRAALFTGAYLLQVCEKDKKGHEIVEGGHAVCQAYIAGVLDYHNVLRSLNLAPKLDICIPKGVTLNNIHDVVLNYMRHHSENDAYIASPIVTMALYQVYPCNK